MTWLQTHRWKLLALVAGLALRLYFIRHHAFIAGDSVLYSDLAGNMLRHHTFGFSEGAVRPTLIRLPGYPLFMAIIFAIAGIGNYTAILYVQLVIDLLACCLIAALASRLMGPRAGNYAIWLAALCPFTANYTASPLTENLSMFCAALAFYSLVRWADRLRAGALSNRWFWPIGFALSMALLLRPDRALLAAAVVPTMAWLAWRGPSFLRTINFMQIALVCLIIAFPLSIWTARNWRTFHVIQPLAPKYANDAGEFVSYGFDRWYRTWAIDFKATDEVYWNYNGAPVVVADLPQRAFDTPDQRARTTKLFDDYNKAPIANAVFDKQFAALAAERVASHPLRYYLVMPVMRVANMWLRPRTEMLPLPMSWWRFSDHPRGSIEAALYAALNLAYLALAASGLWKWRRQNWSGDRVIAYALVGFVLLRSAMLLTVDNSEPRYTIDCYPVVILLAAFAFAGRRTTEISERSLL